MTQIAPSAPSPAFPFDKGSNAGVGVVANQFIHRQMVHAYLLTGARGLGKRTLARTLASALFCTSENRPCGRCEACRRVLEGNEPDVITLFADDGKQIGVDRVREVIQKTSQHAFGDGWRVVLQWIALVFALTICAYTGFLISALIRFPLINQAVLPALFVASGLSAGMAATKAFACLAFGDRHESCDQHLLHAAEWPVMAAEALCIFMIAVSLISGNAAAQAAVEAFVSGTWSTVFWVGVVGVGFVLPVLLHFVKSTASFYLAGLCSVVGMLCLRHFILYAGQIFGL